jgi:hypothetical protein
MVTVVGFALYRIAVSRDRTILPSSTEAASQNNNNSSSKTPS